MPEDLTPQEPVAGDTPAPATPVDNTPVDGVSVNADASLVTPEIKKADGQADAEKTGAPETYADFVFPDGIEVNQEALEAFAPVAKELNLTQEQAQSLVDLQANQMKAIGEAQQTAWDTTIESWTEAARSDKEFGGNDFDANLAIAKAGIEKFGTKELLEAFDATGVGNHPEVIRIFYRIGKLVQDDKMVFGKSNAPSPAKTAAEIMFPNMS